MDIFECLSWNSRRGGVVRKMVFCEDYIDKLLFLLIFSNLLLPTPKREKCLFGIDITDLKILND